MKNRDELLAEWQAVCLALLSAAELNPGTLGEHLMAQEEGYALAIRQVEGKPSNVAGIKASIVVLCEANTTLVNTLQYLPEREKELKTIADIVSVCIASLRRTIPQGVKAS